jgi:hypothetical protein
MESGMMMARFSPGISDARRPGAQTWLNLVWVCNEVRPGFFGAPTATDDWWAGGTFEEYPEARIITDASGVRIVGTSPAGDLVIQEAAERLGVHVTTDTAARASTAGQG